jgi:hypothetical protein
MININYKNFEEDVVATIQEYLDNNPQYDNFDQAILRSDLFMDDKGNVVYAYMWETETYPADGHISQTVAETTRPQYVILLTREQLKSELNAYAKKCN